MKKNITNNSSPKLKIVGLSNYLGNFLVILLIFLMSSVLLIILSHLRSIEASAQAGTEILRPTTYTDSAGRTTNPQLAFDPADGTTWAATQYDFNADSSITFHTWETPTQTYTDLILNYRYHADAANDDSYAVAYSIDGGFSWVDLVSSTSTGASDTTVSVVLPPLQDLSQLQVKIYTTKIGGGDKKNLFTRDIWTEVPVVSLATWREAEDTPTSGVNKNENIRLRIEVTNSGSEAVDYDYLLEYAPKVGVACGDDESFSTVPVTATTEHFEMTDSIYFINGDPTTAQLTVPDTFTFVAGRMVENPSNSSGNITLPFENYTEIEFAFWVTNDATNGGDYCFRLTNAGTFLDNYSVYPELQITP